MPYNDLKEGSRIIILRAPYYEDIVDLLAEGVKLAADEGQWQKGFTNISLPGALELPLVLSLLAERYKGELAQGKLGVVVLGCVLRGETKHFSLICNEVFNGLQRVALKYSIALGTGVLACDNEQQARDRAEKAGKQAFNACLNLMLLRQNPFALMLK